MESPEYVPISSPEYVPISSPEYEINLINPFSSPIVKKIAKKKYKEFTSDWFDMSSKEWRKNKIFSQKKQFFYYKTNTDSVFTLEDYKSNITIKKKDTTQNNSINWSMCKYVSKNGDICTQQGIFYDDEVKNNPEFDYEKYTDIHFCEQHSKFTKKEEHKRELVIECALMERYIKLQNKLAKLDAL
jgi:hypothetical protein